MQAARTEDKLTKEQIQDIKNLLVRMHCFNYFNSWSDYILSRLHNGTRKRLEKQFKK